MADLAGFRAIVSGRVQGVFYRAYVQRFGEQLRLNGFVRNIPDGTVEVHAEGEREKLQRLLDSLKTGPSAARVERIDVEWLEYTGIYAGFRAVY